MPYAEHAINDVGVAHFVALGFVTFFIGAAGALLRRNALMVLMSVELMLNAGNLVLLGYARALGDAHGHAAAFIIMAIAAAEAAVGLAIILSLFRVRQTLNLNELDSLRDTPDIL